MKQIFQAAAVLAVCCVPLSASAQECLLGPVALPGLPGAPEWQDFNSDSFWRPEFHDPRWSGAPFDYLQYPPGSATPVSSADDISVRVVAHGKVLYISYQVQMDANGPDGNDAVYLAFSEGTANGAYALRVTAEAGGAAIGAPADPGVPGVSVVADTPAPTQAVSVSWWHSTDATTGGCATTPGACWSGVAQPVPASAFHAAIWDRPTAMNPRWGITIRLDLTSLSIGGNTRMFFGGRVNIDGNTLNDLILGSFTSKDDGDTDRISDTIIPSQSQQWVGASPDVGLYHEAGTACTSGVTLSLSDVGVWTGAFGAISPGALTNNVCTDATACPHTEGLDNVFRVTARNLDNTGGIGQWSMRPRIRVAEWGSTPGYRAYGPWKDVTVGNTGVSGVALFNAPSSEFTASSQWHWFGPVVDPVDTTKSSLTFDFQCDRGADPYCPKLVAGSDDHQCMLVELGQPPSASQKFRNTSVYRNMTFLGLSEKKVPAKISIEGLKDALGDAQGKDRDVYLYIEKMNLPEHGAEPLWLPTEDMALARQLASNPLTVMAAPSNRVRDGAIGVRQPDDKKTNRGAIAAKQLLSSQKRLANRVPVHQALTMSESQLLDSVWPTYRVRVYYDSGRTFTAEKSKPHKVLVPMVPFGYRLSHDGPLYGFTTTIEAVAGVKLEELTKNWYKVRIESESSVELITTLIAEEKQKGNLCPTCPTACPNGQVCTPKGRGGCGSCSIGNVRDSRPWLLLALGLLVASWRRRRSAQRIG